MCSFDAISFSSHSYTQEAVSNKLEYNRHSGRLRIPRGHDEALPAPHLFRSDNLPKQLGIASIHAWARMWWTQSLFITYSSSSNEKWRNSRKNAAALAPPREIAPTSCTPRCAPRVHSTILANTKIFLMMRALLQNLLRFSWAALPSLGDSSPRHEYSPHCKSQRYFGTLSRSPEVLVSRNKLKMEESLVRCKFDFLQQGHRNYEENEFRIDKKDIFLLRSSWMESEAPSWFIISCARCNWNLCFE